MSEEQSSTTVAEQVETNNTPTSIEAPQAPQAPQEEQPIDSMGERPAWLPEKFKTAEDMANSYSQLESKISQKEDDIKSQVMKDLEAEASF